jgi:hypothetical protein
VATPGHRNAAPALNLLLRGRVDVVGAEGGLLVGTYDSDPPSISYSYEVYFKYIYIVF